MSASKLFVNGTVYTGGAFLCAELLTAGGVIAGLYPRGVRPDGDYEIVDCAGLRIAPGFIDIHIHGRGGHDVTRGGVGEVAALLPKSGVTSFMPATMTESYEGSVKLLGALADYVERQPLDNDVAEAVGIASEGMYFSPEKAGAQNPAFLRKPTNAEVAALLDAGRGYIKSFALAPELPGAIDAIRLIASRGVMPSLAHTDAEYEAMYKAYLAGARGVTHIFNAQRPIHHLALGAGGGSLTLDGLYCEVITDGFHVMPEMLKMLFRTKPLDKIIMISDNVWISGTPKGDYELSGVPVRNEGDRLIVANIDRYSLAGSCLSLDVGLRNVMRFTGLPIEKVLLCLTENPARYIGLENRKGFLRAGCDADLNFIADDDTVRATCLRGRLIGTI